MLHLFVLLFIIQNTIHQRILICIIENGVFLLSWGFKMQMKVSSMVLKIWLFGFGKVLEKLWKCSLKSSYEPCL